MLKASAIATVWQHRGLLRALAVRDIQNRYAGSVVGLLWGFLHPLALLGIYGVVFAYIFRASLHTLAPDQPYLLFVAAALWPWLATQEAITRGTLAVQNHGALVKKVAFPHELLVYSAVIASFLVQMGGFVVVLITLRLLGFAVHFAAWPMVIASALALLVLALAAALVLGALQVFIRDVEQVLSQVMSVLFFATPILYPLSAVPPWMADVMQWNPLVPILETIRMAILDTGNIALTGVALTLLATMFAFYLARRFFLRLSPHFEDMV